MRIAVTGASGFIGSRLVPALRADGHEVLRLVRRPARTADEAAWDPQAGTVDPQALPGIDAVVHLAGASVDARRWTKSYKRVIWESRVAGTRTISAAIAQLDPPPRVLLSASGIDYYGAPAEPVDESAPAGHGFLADLAVAAEQAADPARGAGIRVVHPRSGIVLGAGGPTLGKMLPVFRLGFGGRLGNGKQYWSFISLEDEVRALQFLAERDDLDGGVNLTSPYPVTNADATRALAAALHRPAVFVAPEFAVRLALGEVATQGFVSRQVLPAKLLAAGFAFKHPTIDEAMRAAVAKR